jgi:D-alanyl-D-alanine carboxypeptidase (penicillin-binding protein 5/6)
MLYRLILMFTALLALPVQAFDTRATAAWVFDETTQTVLLAKNADQPLPPASMSKLMTLNMLFEAIQDGRVTIAAQMTERAKALGMTQSTFANASGWPDPNQRMSMHDLGLLARRLIEEFPEEYAIFKETEFNFANRAEANRFNRNPLLKLNIGADGLKTGHTSEAGYGLVGSTLQGNRRVIFVITGLDSDTARAEEAERIVNWAYRQFVLKTVAKAGVRVAEAPVWLGGESSVGLVPAKDVALLVPALVQEGISAEVSYTGPLSAPLTAGQPVAELIIHVPDLPDARIPLVTEAAVTRAGFVGRLTTAAQVLYARFAAEAPAS